MNASKDRDISSRNNLFRHENVNTALALSAFAFTFLASALPDARELVASIDHPPITEKIISSGNSGKIPFYIDLHNSGDTPLKINFLNLYIGNDEKVPYDQIKKYIFSDENDNPLCRKAWNTPFPLPGSADIPVMMKPKESIKIGFLIETPQDARSRGLCLDISVRDRAGYQHNFTKSLGEMKYVPDGPGSQLQSMVVGVDDYVMILNRKRCFQIFTTEICNFPSILLSDFGI